MGPDPEEERLKQTVESTIRRGLEDAMGQSLKGLSIEQISKKLGMTQGQWEAGFDGLEDEDLAEGAEQNWTQDDFENMVRSSDYDGNMSQDFFLNQLSQEERTEMEEQSTIVSRITNLMDKWESKENFTEEEIEALRKELLQGMTEEDRIRSEEGVIGWSLPFLRRAHILNYV